VRLHSDFNIPPPPTHPTPPHPHRDALCNEVSATTCSNRTHPTRWAPWQKPRALRGLIPAGAVENWPATQSLHDVAPGAAYRPDAHMAAGGLADVDAAGHAYPAAHTAVHVDTDKPCVLPYLPAGQSVQLLAPAVDEYRPTAHSVHDPARPDTKG
jgi:hypothetical protein